MTWDDLPGGDLVRKGSMLCGMAAKRRQRCSSPNYFRTPVMTSRLARAAASNEFGAQTVDYLGHRNVALGRRNAVPELRPTY
jgi:hypothetical protein